MRAACPGVDYSPQCPLIIRESADSSSVWRSRVTLRREPGRDGQTSKYKSVAFPSGHEKSVETFHGFMNFLYLW